MKRKVLIKCIDNVLSIYLKKEMIYEATCYGFTLYC